jgi:hypothetical protein
VCVAARSQQGTGLWDSMRVPASKAACRVLTYCVLEVAVAAAAVGCSLAKFHCGCCQVGCAEGMSGVRRPVVSQA